MVLKNDPDALASTTMESSVTQYGITWTFDKEYPVGQFVTGDYFVVGDTVTVSSVNPASSGTGTSFRDGSMVNPGTSEVWKHAYDGRANTGDVFDEDLDVSFPVALSANDSLCSSISNETDVSWSYVNTIAVLTVLSTAPYADCFRPPCVGTTRTLFRWSTVVGNLGLIPNLTLPDGASLPDASAYSGRPEVIHVPAYMLRYNYPSSNYPPYYGDRFTLWGPLALAISVRTADWSSEADRLAMIRKFVQTGIDDWGFHSAGLVTYYNSFFPTVFAGLMLGDSDLLNAYLDGGAATYEYFTSTLFYYREIDTRYGSGPSIGDGTYDDRPSDVYPIRNNADTIDLGMKVTEFDDADGIQDVRTGYYARTGKRPIFYPDALSAGATEPYNGYVQEILHPTDETLVLPGDSLTRDYGEVWYRLENSQYLTMFTLAALILGIDDKIKNGAKYVLYADRWMYETQDIITDSDLGSIDGRYASMGSAFANAMWEDYRGDY